MRLRRPVPLGDDGFYSLPHDAPPGAELRLEWDAGDTEITSASMVASFSAHAALRMIGEGWERVDAD